MVYRLKFLSHLVSSSYVYDIWERAFFMFEVVDLAYLYEVRMDCVSLIEGGLGLGRMFQGWIMSNFYFFTY